VSNYLAIATVTATLRGLLLPVISADVNGAEVTTVRPDGAGSNTPTVGVNLYLYQVTPNAAWRNDDLPTRGSDGQPVQHSRVALDLNYLLTFYGNEAALQPQRCLGSVARELHSRPVLTRQKIRDTINSVSYLTKSDLDEQVELVKFTPLPLSLEELSKLWSVFFQTAYTLSVAYQGTVVLIEGKEEPKTALPVLERGLYGVPLLQPVVEQVVSQAGLNLPIIEGSTVVLRGKQLGGGVTEVRVGEKDPIKPAPQNVSESQITVKLPTGLRAGVQGAQVIHSLDIGTPAAPHRIIESNVAAFVLHPIVRKKSNGDYDVVLSNPQGTGNAPRSADVTVRLRPKVGKNQRVTLELLKGETIAHLFAVAPPNAATDEITFHISDVMTGIYFVRVRVDGAESPLDRDVNNQPIAPKVTIT
jgi:hypothetical protein